MVDLQMDLVYLLVDLMGALDGGLHGDGGEL